MKLITDVIRVVVGIAFLCTLGACQIDRGPWTSDPDYNLHARKITELKKRLKFLGSQLATCQNRPSASSQALIHSGAFSKIGSTSKGWGFGTSVIAASSAVAGDQNGVAGLRPLTEQQIKARERQLKEQISHTERELKEHNDKKEAIQQKYTSAKPPSPPDKGNGKPPPPLMPKKPMFDDRSDRGGKEYNSAEKPSSPPNKGNGKPLPPSMPKKPMHDERSDRGGAEYNSDPAASQSTLQ